MSDYTESRINLNSIGVSATSSWVTTDMGVPSTARKVHLENVDLRFTSIVTATSFDWYISADEAGEYNLTPVQTAAVWATGKGTGKLYAAAVVRSRSPCFRGEGIYLHIKLDAGTATVDAFIEGARI